MSNRSLATCCLVLVLFSACGGGGNDSVPVSQTPTPAPPTPNTFGCPQLPASTATAGSLASIVDASVASEMIANGLPGMTVAIAKNGTVLYSKGYGYANVSSCAPVQTNTEYQIGSITKQFTAAAILQLQNAGKLNIDNTVISYLPSYSFDPRITLRMLLNHTAGLDDYVNNPAQFPPPPGWEQGLSQNYILTLISQAPLLFAPGSAFEYSNSGYFILGSIIETVTGLSYPEYMSTRIFQPLGLSHTFYLQPITAASPYTYTNPLVPGTKGLALGLIPDPSIYFATGALWSSVEDLAAWDAALRNGNVIPPALFTLMVSPTLAPVFRQANSQSSYAMGWVRITISGHPLAGHSGQTNAYTAYNGLFLDDGFSVTALTNVDIQSDDLSDFGAKLIQAICSSSATASNC